MKLPSPWLNVLGLVKHGRRTHSSSIVNEALSILRMRSMAGGEGAGLRRGVNLRNEGYVSWHMKKYRAHDGRDGA